MLGNLGLALAAGQVLLSLPACDALTIERRDGIVPTTLPGSWVSQGCYVDVGRTLTGGGYDDSEAMTDESCIDYCSSAGFIYAGTEYSSQCYCGNTLATGSGPAPDGDCDMTCSGNATEACGGPNRLNLFWSGTTGPETNPGTGNWTFSACYTEGVTGRALPFAATVVGGAAAMTVDLCLSACETAGYVLAGTEYADECWCGDSIASGATVAPEGISGCDMLCSGNFSEFCGGSDRLDVYTYQATTTLPTTTTTATATATPTQTLGVKPVVGDYTFQGCYTEATDSRALSDASFYDYEAMTLEECATDCAAYDYFGVEYGGECYCGNTINNGSVVAALTDCNFVCPGDPYEYCGAGNRLEMYLLTTMT